MNNVKISLVLLSCGLSACAGLGGLMGGGARPDDSGVATGAAAAPARYEMPKSEVKVDVVDADHLKLAPTLIVPTVYVKFPVAGKVSVTEQGSALAAVGRGNANTVKASAQFTVKGLDKALAQKIAAAAYRDLVAQLRAAGHNVLTYDDIRSREVIADADRESPDREWGLPTEKIWGGSVTAIVAAPSDEQAFEGGMAGGVFNQFISLGKTKVKDGVLIIPQYVVSAPQMWGEKSSSYSSIGAAVRGAPAMVLAGADAFWFGPNPPVRMMRGIPGVHMKGLSGLAEDVGELVMVEDTTSGAANALSSTLSFLSGTGSIKSQSAKFDMVIDAAAYEKAALEGVRRFNAEVAKVAAENRP